MSKAVDLIVASYVKVRDPRALEAMLAHRRGMLARLEALSGSMPSAAVQTIEEEIAIVAAGLEELKPPPGSLPENEWT